MYTYLLALHKKAALHIYSRGCTKTQIAAESRKAVAMSKLRANDAAKPWNNYAGPLYPRLCPWWGFQRFVGGGCLYGRAAILLWAVFVAAQFYVVITKHRPFGESVTPLPEALRLNQFLVEHVPVSYCDTSFPNKLSTPYSRQVLRINLKQFRKDFAIFARRKLQSCLSPNATASRNSLGWVFAVGTEGAYGNAACWGLADILDIKFMSNRNRLVSFDFFDGQGQNKVGTKFILRILCALDGRVALLGHLAALEFHLVKLALDNPSLAIHPKGHKACEGKLAENGNSLPSLPLTKPLQYSRAHMVAGGLLTGLGLLACAFGIVALCDRHGRVGVGLLCAGSLLLVLVWSSHFRLLVP